MSTIDKNTIAGWVLTILLSSFGALMSSSMRLSDVKETGEINKTRIEALEKNEGRIIRIEAKQDKIQESLIRIESRMDLKQDRFK
jgi:hypothetical protein